MKSRASNLLQCWSMVAGKVLKSGTVLLQSAKIIAKKVTKPLAAMLFESEVL